MIIFPKAKINIGLRITNRRDDGYHDIETVFYPIRLSDALEFVVQEENPGKDSLTVTGLNTGCEPENNLVLKAAAKLREHYSFPGLRLHLHKAITVSAGLGGGSSDAVSFLLMANRFFSLSMDDHKLEEIALGLGSDCPFFISGTPAFANGRGEITTPIAPVLAGYYLCLLNPGFGINTREAYLNCTPAKPSSSLNDLIVKPVASWRGEILNDFESFAFSRYPLLEEIKEELYINGALFSLMSGSGSSVYGIFPGKVNLPDKLRRMVIYEGIM
jgi:4-diphosphocytidyl-2-C-methyl-D-erythritol kinase